MPPSRALPCPHHAICGLCTEMPRAEDEQLAGRVARVTRSLGRPPDQVVPAPRAVGYRARVRFGVDAQGRLCYHQPRSSALTAIPACALARPEIDAVIAAMPPLPPGLEAVELRSDGARVVWVGTPARRSNPQLVDQVRDLDLARLGLAGVVLGGTTLSGDGRAQLCAGGVRHLVSPSVFYQVNLELNEVLVQTIAEVVLALRPATVLDLYAGYGNLSLPLAAQGVPVVLWESNTAALADARRTIARDGLPATTHAGDAARFRAGNAFFDVAVLDPPAAGAPGGVAARGATRPRALVVVSCFHANLSRDLRPALEAGYRVTRAVVLDFFPQTPLAETLVVLTRP